MTATDRETFADRLNFLIKQKAAGRELSLSTLAADIKEQSGVTISKAYLSDLRHGNAPEPRLDVVRALASYFAVDPAYFISSSDVHTQLAAGLVSAGVEEVSLRAVGLSDKSIQHLLGIVDSIRAIEGLPPHDGTPPA